MAFFEIEFPRHIGFKRLGGPIGFSTIVNEGFSGQEQRNRNRLSSRGKWTIDLTTPSIGQFSGSRQSYINTLISFMLVIGGMADPFRFYDHLDNSWNTPQALAELTSTTFQLQKTYTIGPRSYVRTITKPIWSTITDYQGAALPNSVQIAVGGTLVTSGWTLDPTTGIVTFGSAPGGAVTSPAGQFHYPVRFDTDDPQFQVEDSAVNAGQVIVGLHSIGLKEVLPPNY